MAQKICFASIDIEKDLGTGELRGVEKLDETLNIFKKYGISATLFVTGEVLEKYADLAKEWSRNYEIASHSFTHRFWDTLNRQERETELNKFCHLYQNIFQKKPLGFRAPSHIIDESGLKLLDSQGFSYDSSILPHYPPLKRYRGYRGKAPLSPHRVKETAILEIPVRGQVFGIPLAGAWIKKLPFFFFQVLFFFCQPPYITLNMHSWDAGSHRFPGKLEKIIKLLKKKNYLFLNGEQILKNRE